MFPAYISSDSKLTMVRERLETFPFGVFAFRSLKDCLLGTIRTMQGECIADASERGEPQTLMLQYVAIRMRLLFPRRVVSTIWGVDNALRHALLCILGHQITGDKFYIRGCSEALQAAKRYYHHEASCLRDAMDIVLQTITNMPVLEGLL